MKIMKDSWTQSTLDKCTSLIKDGSHGTHKDVLDGVPLLSAKDVRDGILEIPNDCRRISELDYSCIHKNYEIMPNDILLTIVGTIGRCYLIKESEPRFTVQRSVAIIRPNGLQPEYLYHYFRSQPFQINLKNLTNASAQGGVYLGALANCSISIPTDRCIQSKIAEILSTIDRAIEQTEAVIAKQQRIKTGMMQDLLTRGIDEHGNLRSEQTHKFKDSPLGRIPAEWQIVHLGNISEISSGITLGKIYSGPDTVELPYLRVANVQDGYLDLSSVNMIRIPKSQVEKYILHVGDVLMNEGGDFDKLGRGSVWKGAIRDCLHQNHVFKVRPKSGILASDYLAAVSSSPYGKAFFVLASKQSTNLASINSTQLKAFPIPLPDYDEQLRIEDLTNQWLTAFGDTVKYLNKLRSLKAALMQDLLTGKVRVLNRTEV